MKARYIRVSSISQNTARQEKSNSDEIQYIDKISGAIPFNERPQAKKLLEAINDGKITMVVVNSIDRLGRSTLDVLNTLNDFTKFGVSVRVENLGLDSLTPDGKENATFKLISAVMANLSEMERTTLRERQMEGILIAKHHGKYKGREKGITESRETFLAKYPKVVSYLKRETPPTIEEIGKLCDCNKNTVLKVKKYLKTQHETV